MRIVIDLQGAQSLSRFRGIGRYSLALTQGIIRNRGQHPNPQKNYWYESDLALGW